MKTFEQYSKKDEMVELFISLAHLDELEIKFNLIDYSDILFYFYKENWLFSQEKKYKQFYIRQYDILSVIEKKFGINYTEIGELVKDLVDKYFKLKDYKIIRGNSNIII